MPKKCHGKVHKNMNHFTEVCSLLMLSEGKNHGYGLKEAMEEFIFGKDQINIGTLYKTLRKMEKNNLVESSWAKGDGGPKKRVYSITDAGLKALEEWIDFIKFRKDRINQVLKRYDNNSMRKEA